MRHEEKYICSERQLEIIEHRLKTILPFDANQEGSDYGIRSLYFDTVDDRMYHESLYGVDRRSKYRIRFYNMSEELFRMERKDAVGRMKQKHSSVIDKNTVRSLVEGRPIHDSEDEVVHEVHLLQKTEGLHPVVIVDYRRCAFTCPTGNVRITIDRDISCTHCVYDFMEDHPILFPVMPYRKHILEVKYDGILPGYIVSAVDVGTLEQVSVSKYVFSRNVIEGNGRREYGYEF